MDDTTVVLRAAPGGPLDRDDAAFGIDVALLRWPDEEALRQRLRRDGSPRLLLVAEGAPSPAEWDDLEDWVRLPLEPGEIAARRETLRRRALRRLPVIIDGDGLLRRGRKWAALPAAELAVLQPLLDAHGRLVPRRVLLAAVRPDQQLDEARTLDTLVQRVRRRSRPFGVTIHTVRGCGFLLEIGEPVP